jgi:hypothetical protein
VIDKSAFDVIGNYYTRPSDSDFVPGRICDAIVYYLPLGPLDVLRFDFDAANRGEPVRYTIGSVDERTFDHRPIVRPRPLGYDEAFVVARAKRRPVVILSTPSVRPPITGLPKQDFAEVYLVAPLYSFRDSHPREFRLRIEAWEYCTWFHLPRSDEFELYEGFLRLDRCLVIPRGQLRPRPVALTTNALFALHHCLWWFLTGELHTTLADYRRHLLEALEEALRQT